MPAAERIRSPRLPQALAAVLGLQLAVGSAVVAASTSPATAPAAAPATAPVTAPPAAPQPAGAVRLSAPGLWSGAVQARPLGVDASGALAVPATADALGWWGDGPRPGTDGAAVVVGHVDLGGEPGVFGRLATARPGALVVVTSGGDAVRFRVVSVDRYAKRAFPTDVVYRPSGVAELRLVTCGGPFDRRTGHYEDNVVVRAVRA